MDANCKELKAFKCDQFSLYYKSERKRLGKAKGHQKNDIGRRDLPTSHMTTDHPLGL